MTPEEIVERAAEVLVGHQRMNSQSCLCGWGELGRSHPKHQAQVLAAAGLIGDLAMAWDEGMRAGWGDRTKSFLQARTYEQEIERATPNPYRQEVTS